MVRNNFIQNHLRHDGVDRPVRCKVPGCPRVFKVEQTRDHHMRVDHGSDKLTEDERRVLRRWSKLRKIVSPAGGRIRYPCHGCSAKYSDISVHLRTLRDDASRQAHKDAAQLLGGKNDDGIDIDDEFDEDASGEDEDDEEMTNDQDDITDLRHQLDTAHAFNQQLQTALDNQTRQVQLLQQAIGHLRQWGSGRGFDVDSIVRYGMNEHWKHKGIVGRGEVDPGPFNPWMQRQIVQEAGYGLGVGERMQQERRLQQERQQQQFEQQRHLQQNPEQHQHQINAVSVPAFADISDKVYNDLMKDIDELPGIDVILTPQETSTRWPTSMDDPGDFPDIHGNITAAAHSTHDDQQQPQDQTAQAQTQTQTPQADQAATTPSPNIQQSNHTINYSNTYHVANGPNSAQNFAPVNGFDNIGASAVAYRPVTGDWLQNDMDGQAYQEFSDFISEMDGEAAH